MIKIKNGGKEKQKKKQKVSKFTVKVKNSQIKKIIEFIEENGKITDDDIQRLFKLKNPRAFVLAKQMRDMGLIKVAGRGSDKYYY